MKLTDKEISERKTNVQTKVVELSSVHSFLTLSFCTGLGKSLSAIRIINVNANVPWLIVIDKLVHVNNFKEEFKKHGYEDLLEIVTFTTYRSIHKHIKEHSHVILDECHHITETSLAKLSMYGHLKKVVALSATIKFEKESMLQRVSFANKLTYRKLTYELSEAIKDGLIPSPDVRVISVPISDKDYVRYMAQEIDVESAKKTYMAVRHEGARVQWMRKALDLKNLVGEMKLDAARQILASVHFKNKRRIVFANSIAQANEFGGDNAIHSEKENNNEIIDMFNTHKIDSIFCVRMAREAMNLHDIETGLVIQLDNQILSTTQILGRILRSEDPIMYVLELDIPLDRKYIKNNLHEVAGAHINRYSLSDIVKQLNKAA